MLKADISRGPKSSQSNFTYMIPQALYFKHVRSLQNESCYNHFADNEMDMRNLKCLTQDKSL